MMTAPICLCCNDCYYGQGGDQGLAAGGMLRAYDGMVTYRHDDWHGARGFNMPFNNELSYYNRWVVGVPPLTEMYGKQWLPHDLAALMFDEWFVSYPVNSCQREEFAATEGGNYEAAFYVRYRFYLRTSPSSSSGPGDDYYEMVDPHGGRRRFDLEGKLISFTDAYGHEGMVSYGDGLVEEVAVLGPGSTSWKYQYERSGGKITTVTLLVKREGVGSSSSSSGAGSGAWNPLYQEFEEVTGRVVLRCGQAAIVEVDEGNDALVTLNEMDGLINLFEYSNGNLELVSIREGIGGDDPIKRVRRTFTVADDPPAGLGDIYFLESEIVYLDEEDEDKTAVTGYAYAWYPDSFQMSERTVALPAVLPEENGSDVSAVIEEFFDEWGYLSMRVDERGTATEFEYDKAVGAMTRRDDDADGGALIPEYTVDDLGRPVRTLGPEHEIDIEGTPTDIRSAQWIYYNDRDDQICRFGGYRAGETEQIVGPVSVSISISDAEPLTDEPAYEGWRQEWSIDAK